MSRAKWKIPFTSSIFFRKEFLNSYSFTTHKRSSTININFIDKRLRVYNGSKYISFIIKKNMIGNKIGDFSIPKVMGSAILLSKYLKMKAKRKKKK